jgi:succinate dehydrogenase / fumarate reductase membrane anchor subunit
MIGMNSSFGHSGAHDFKMQRLSAGFLILYLIFMMVSVYCISDFNYTNWSAIFAPLWVKIFTFLSVTAISIHAWAGLWIVSTDYLKQVTVRNLFQLIVLIVCLGIIVWTGLIFWG